MRAFNILAAGVIAIGCAGTALAQDTVVLTFAADSPTRGNVCTGYMDVWAARVEKESNGRLKIDMKCDGVLGKVGDSVDRVAAGVADIAWDLPFAYGARFAGLGVVGVPGLYDDPEIAAGALWNLYEKGESGTEFGNGVKLLWVQAVPNTAYYLESKPDSVTSLAGQKIAMGSKQRAVMVQTMGGTPIQLAPPEYYQAMQKGAATGAQSTVGAIAAYKLQELLHYYIYGPFGGGFTFIVMNQAKYDALPDDLKKVIDDNSGYEMSRQSAVFLRDYEAKFMDEEMLTVPGNEQVFLTPEQTETWKPAFDAAAASWVEGVPDGQKVLEAFKAELAAETAKAGG